MTEVKEIKFRTYTFIKISSNPLTVHCQAAQATIQSKGCQKATILPSYKSVNIKKLSKINKYGINSRNNRFMERISSRRNE